MTSRERVLAAVNGLPVDRVPVMYWLNPHTTCRLLAEFQTEKNKVSGSLGKSIWKRFVRRGEMEADALSRILPILMEEYGNSIYTLELGGDIAVLSPDFISPSTFISSIRYRSGSISVRGAFGGRMTLAGIYMHPYEPAVSSPAQLSTHQLPRVTARHFNGVRKFRQEHPDACLLVEIGAMQQLLCDYIIGSEAFMLALYDYPHEIKAYMKRLGAWLIDIIHLAASAGADIIFLQDDYGYNNRPLISMKMWEDITFPQLARLVDAAHKHNLPFMLHSCGYQMPFLEKYIEAEIDVLQSFQVGAGNDLSHALEITKGKLTFATGIDVQNAESMSPLDLGRSIRSAYDIGIQNSRFILAMTHMLQHSLSLESYQSIFGTVRQLQNAHPSSHKSYKNNSTKDNINPNQVLTES